MCTCTVCMYTCVHVCKDECPTVLPTGTVAKSGGAGGTKEEETKSFRRRNKISLQRLQQCDVFK